MFYRLELDAKKTDHIGCRVFRYKVIRHRKRFCHLNSHDKEGICQHVFYNSGRILLWGTTFTLLFSFFWSNIPKMSQILNKLNFLQRVDPNLENRNNFLLYWKQGFDLTSYILRQVVTISYRFSYQNTDFFECFLITNDGLFYEEFSRTSWQKYCIFL